MVKEIEGSGLATGRTAGCGESVVFSGVSDDGASGARGLATMVGAVVRLAIASPIPPAMARGSEKLANQCSPVSQLNSSRLT